MAKTFRFKGPDGQTYKINAPDDATEEQAFEILQSQIDMRQPEEAAPERQPFSDIGPVASMDATPRSVVESEQAAQEAGPLKKAGKAALNTYARTGRGIRQAFATDPATISRLEDKENLRRMEEAPWETGVAGTLGGLAGSVGQMVGPAAGVRGALKALPHSTRLGAVLKALTTNAVPAAAYGVSQPVVGDEERSDNAMLYGATGAAGPAIGAAAKAAVPIATSIPLAGSYVASKTAAGAAKSAVDRAGTEAASYAQKEAGKTIGKRMANVLVPTRDAAGKKPTEIVTTARRVLKDYPTSLPGDTRKVVEDIAGRRGKPFTGEEVQEMWMRVFRAAQKEGGDASVGLEALGRALKESAKDAQPGRLSRGQLTEAMRVWGGGAPDPKVGVAGPTTASLIDQQRNQQRAAQLRYEAEKGR